MTGIMDYFNKMKPEEKRNYLIIIAIIVGLAVIDILIFHSNPPFEWILIELAIIGFILFFLYRNITSKPKRKRRKKKKSRRAKEADKIYRKTTIMVDAVRLILLALAAVLIYNAFLLPEGLVLLYAGIGCIAVVAILSIYANRRHEKRYGRSYPD